MRIVKVVSTALMALLVSASTVFADIVDVPAGPGETEVPKEPPVLPVVLIIGAAVIVIALIIKSRKKK